MTAHRKQWRRPSLTGLLAAVLLAPVAAAQQPEALPDPKPVAVAGGLSLGNLIELGLARNPRLRQAELAVDVASGEAVQAGLYPNPTVSINGEEIGRRGGIHAFPQVSQQIVTAGKLRFARAAAERGVDQATLGVMRQRYELFTAIRQGYFEVLGLQRRVEVLVELVKLANQAYENAKKLQEAKLVAELEVLQFEVERDRLRADLEATRRERVAALQRLASSIGLQGMPDTTLAGSLELPLPVFDYEAVREFVLEAHPEVLSAQVGITRSQLMLRQEQVKPIPNVTLMAGYQKNYNDRDDQVMYGVSLPLPVFDRNQGNIRAAQAELARASQGVDTVRNDLVNRLSAAFGQYSPARERAERYRTAILPNARRAYQLSFEAFKGGQFEYLRVIQAQRSIAEANLEYTRALTDAWRAASQIAGLLLEEHWMTAGPHGQKPCAPPGPPPMSTVP